jgi:hypothetical protein
MTKTIICMVCFGMVLGEIVTILPASAPKYQKPYHTETAYFHGRRVYPVAPFWSEMYGFGMVLVWFFFVRNGCKFQQRLILTLPILYSRTGTL